MLIRTRRLFGPLAQPVRLFMAIAGLLQDAILRLQNEAAAQTSEIIFRNN